MDYLDQNFKPQHGKYTDWTAQIIQHELDHVAAMALGKKAYAIHPSGKWYTDENIDQMLLERHLAKKARRASSRNHLKGSHKRTAEDDQRFEESFEKLLCKAFV